MSALTLTKTPTTARLSLAKVPASPAMRAARAEAEAAAVVVPSHGLTLRRPFLAEGVLAWSVFGGRVAGGWDVAGQFFAEADVETAAPIVF